MNYIAKYTGQIYHYIININIILITQEYTTVAVPGDWIFLKRQMMCCQEYGKKRVDK